MNNATLLRFANVSLQSTVDLLISAPDFPAKLLLVFCEICAAAIQLPPLKLVCATETMTHQGIDLKFRPEEIALGGQLFTRQ